jgi:SAM-dependent methyltransferase
MGRYSRPLAVAFADAAGVTAGHSALDVGCGPGALTGVLADRLGPGSVHAIDPSAPFVAECRARHPEVDVRLGHAEAIPFAAGSLDRVLAQLVLHFVNDPVQAAGEFLRVLRPGGVAAACSWDFTEGMEMLRHFWGAALAIDPAVPAEARTLRLSREGEVAELFASAGLSDVAETTVEVHSTYADFEELWSGFLAGIGPAGSYCLGLTEDRRAALREELFHRLGSPAGPFTLAATARCASGRAPS